MSASARGWLVLALASLVAWGARVPIAGAQGDQGRANAFANPGFELGRDDWRLDMGPGTVARFAVDGQQAIQGDQSAVVTVDKVGTWGIQLGQSVDAGAKGKTYTIAAFARSLKGPVRVALAVERRAEPYDRATTSEPVTLKEGEWTELHATFTIANDYPQGWFAYIECSQPGAQFRADEFRLYEGDYVPYRAAATAPASAEVRVFDTGKASAQPLDAAAFDQRDGWAQLKEGDAGHEFSGDAVILNNRIAVALRPGSAAAELYSLGPDGVALRARLSPIAGKQSPARAGVRAMRAEVGGASLAATFGEKGEEGLTVTFGLKTGHVFVSTEAGAGVTALRVGAPCRFAVLPDFFADDIVADATELPMPRAELPGESFLLQLLPDRHAIVMSVWNASDGDVGITLDGQGAQRQMTSAEIPYGKGGKAWVAVLDAPNVWHTQEVSAQDAGKVVRLDWKAPYPAQWRTDWRRDDGLTDSWEMAVEKPNGEFTKPGWFGDPDTLAPDRKRWTTVLGWFEYPCWMDKLGQGYLQPIKRGERFLGPALIYPINRLKTPLDAYTVVDVVRATLGVGPCEYILDVEGQASEYKGMATCGVRDTLNPIYEKGQQKQRRAEVEKALDDVMIFIRHIRSRIEGYVAFGDAMKQYLAEQKAARPELAQGIGDLETVTGVIDQKLAARRAKIRTPEYAAQLVAEFRKTVLDYEGPDALAKCKVFTEAWVDMGGNQDELVGECRWAVKVLRQRAALAVAADPRLAEVAKEIRRRSQEVLRNPAGHEGARH